MDILNVIFYAREEELAKLTETDKAYLSSHCNSTKAYTNLEKLVNDSCPRNAYNILSAIDDFISEINFESGYFNEKYYKQGFCDGFRLVHDIITIFSL